MLVFKKNIYYQPLHHLSSATSPYGEDEMARPSAYNLIHEALSEDQRIFQEIETLPDSEAADRLNILFPHAMRFGTVSNLAQISRNLNAGLTDPSQWLKMNCYHLCYLYDSLLEGMEDYSYADTQHRLELMPELCGQEFDFNQFLNEYFFNTVFLMAAERFNKMPAAERRHLGKLDHAYFGALLPTDNPVDQEDPTLARVINAQPPSPEELDLIPELIEFYAEFPERLEWDYRTFSETIPNNQKDQTTKELIPFRELPLKRHFGPVNQVGGRKSLQITMLCEKPLQQSNPMTNIERRRREFR